MASKDVQVNIKGNNKDLLQKLKEGEKGMQEFKKQGSSALDSLASNFGINTGKIGQMTNSIKTMVQGFQALGQTGAGALGGISAGAAAAAASLGAIAVGGLVVSFKELNREAELFKSTMAGMNDERVMNTWMDTFSMSSANLDRGMNWDNMKDRFQQNGKILGTLFSQTFTNTFADGMLPAAAAAAARETVGAAVADAEKAAGIQEKLNKWLNEGVNRQKEWVRLQVQLSELRRQASDTSGDEAKRQEAITEALRVQEQLGRSQAEVYGAIYKYTHDINEVTTTSEEGIKAENDMYAKWQQSVASLNNEMRSLEKLRNRINGGGGGSAKESPVSKAILAASLQMEEATDQYLAQLDRQQTAILDMTLNPSKYHVASITPQGVTGGSSMGSLLVPELSEEEKKRQAGYLKFLQDMVDATQEANQQINEAIVQGMASSFDYLAECLWGLQEISPGGLMNALLTPLAEACIKIGELVMAAGIASDAFKNSLRNPYTAIAAGAALMAVGALAKAGIQKAIGSTGSAGYASNAGVASSAYTGGSSAALYEREMSVKVTGTLTANGSALVAVLNNEENRRGITT